ncbi:MAG: hypothetical protein Q8R28_15850 [Dehalococcoidia bacterium]|nr:hypothetical protein [Dehalococcoidia bacterium]
MEERSCCWLLPAPAAFRRISTPLQSEPQAKDKELQGTASQLEAEESEIAKLRGAPTPPPAPLFGTAVETFDANGPPAHEAMPGSLLGFVQPGMGNDSPADATMSLSCAP